MRLARALVASLVVFAFTAPAGEVDAASRSHAEKKKPRSVGAPNHGKLEGASLLHGGKHLIFRHGAHSYGTPELTHALKHAAEKVANKYAGSVMLLGDLSGKEGGQLAGHGSHQSGRDADVGFYV
ncbi:MAG TPA: penicillin-insensitive murein endopeptidase, partial [Byssovorax sp.]